MSQTVNVIACFKRTGGGYTITFKGGQTAKSDREILPGTDVIVRDRKVIA